MLGIVALDWIQKGLLAERTVVGTVQCNAGLDATLKKAGGQLIRTEVGDRPVTQRMFEDGLNFGGEPSGHFVFRDCLPTGDGLIAALQLLNIRLGTGCPLAQLRQVVSLFSQALANLRVSEKLPLDSLPAFQEELAGIVRLLAEDGRVLVRYSGTERKVRLLADGRTEALARQTMESLLDLARNYLNTVDNAVGK